MYTVSGVDRCITMTETGGKVLVADDDADFRALYRVWMPEVYDLRMAVDGRDALDQLTDDVDVVVLDRKMPRLRGETVAATIDERDIDPTVVMISSIEPGAELDESTIDQYLQKPVGRDAFLAAIDRGTSRSDHLEPARLSHGPRATESP